MYLNYNFIGPGPLPEKVQEREIEAINQVLPLGYKAQKTERNWWSWDKNDKKQYGLLLLIILIIYFVTAILFESLLKPLAVISLIPISFIGVFLTFYLFDFNFDQGGFASFILLSGLVVNAAIYIINDFNNLVRGKSKSYSIETYLKAFNNKIVAIANHTSYGFRLDSVYLGRAKRSILVCLCRWCYGRTLVFDGGNIGLFALVIKIRFALYQ